MITFTSSRAFFTQATENMHIYIFKFYCKIKNLKFTYLTMLFSFVKLLIPVGILARYLSFRI